MYEELEKVAAECEEVASTFDRDPLDSIIRRSREAAQSLATSASKSWAGYHARCYYGQFEPAETPFDIEWGLHGPPYSSGRTPTRWKEYKHEEIIAEIERRSGVTNMELLVQAAEEARKVFARCKREVLTTIDAEMDDDTSASLRGLQQKVADLEDSVNGGVFIHHAQPAQISTRDRRFPFEGVVIPPHISYEAQVMDLASCAGRLRDLAELARTPRAYFQKKEQRELRKPTPRKESAPMTPPAPAPEPTPMPIPGVTPMVLQPAQTELDRPWDLLVIGALVFGVVLGVFGPSILEGLRTVVANYAPNLSAGWRTALTALVIALVGTLANLGIEVTGALIERDGRGPVAAVLRSRRVRSGLWITIGFAVLVQLLTQSPDGDKARPAPTPTPPVDASTVEPALRPTVEEPTASTPPSRAATPAASPAQTH